MTMMATEVRVAGLGRPKLAAIRKKARKLGLTPEAYVKQLIDNDLELDHLTATRSLSELSSPIREAFKHSSEEEIGRLVDASRSRHRRKLSKR